MPEEDAVLVLTDSDLGTFLNGDLSRKEVEASLGAYYIYIYSILSEICRLVPRNRVVLLPTCRKSSMQNTTFVISRLLHVARYIFTAFQEEFNAQKLINLTGMPLLKNSQQSSNGAAQ